MGKIKKMITGAAVTTFLCGMVVFVSSNTCLAGIPSGASTKTALPAPR